MMFLLKVNEVIQEMKAAGPEEQKKDDRCE